MIVVSLCLQSLSVSSSPFAKMPAKKKMTSFSSGCTLPLWVGMTPMAGKKRAIDSESIDEETAKVVKHDTQVAKHDVDKNAGIQVKAKPPAPGRGNPALAHRRDAPQVNFSIRGDFQLALPSTSSPHDRAEALSEYQRDKYSTTGGSVRAAAWSTWSKFHQHWHGVGCPVLPLTAAKVEGALTVFKRGRYMSIGNYLSVA